MKPYLKFQPPAAFDRSQPEKPLRARNAKDEQVLGEVWRLVHGGYPHFDTQATQAQLFCQDCGASVDVISGPDFRDGVGPLQIASHACGGEG
jgi:hypothetical protein